MSSRAFEDFPIGTRLLSPSYLVTADAVTGFASEFDPQVFHLNEDKAKLTIFEGLAASGWHTAAISMRLFVDTMSVAGGIVGLGVDDLKWPTAVRAGDELRLEIEIVDARVSKSRVGYGILHIRNVTRNQRNQIVQSFSANALMPRRE